MKYFYQRGATAAVALIISLTGGYATAQNYPAKPVTIYVGFPAGSTNDSTANIATISDNDLREFLWHA